MSLRRLADVVAVVGLAALAAGSSAPAAPPAWHLFEDVRTGISMRYPAGWHVYRRPLTSCTDPVQRVAVGSTQGGALIMLIERRYSDDGLPPRPRRLTLEGEAAPIACCAPLDRPGHVVRFSDGGRGFYAYVYVTPSTRAAALGALNSLRVRPAWQATSASAP
jgi:hypothetical protein